MKLGNFEQYKFKLRSLPNTKNFRRYLDGFMYYIATLAAFNFFSICILQDDLSPTLPPLFVLALPIGFFNIYFSIETEFKNVNKDSVREAIIHIRLKQTQSLVDKLEEHPEILYESYNKKSLLYWARYHKNIEANSIIIERMKKGATKC